MKFHPFNLEVMMWRIGFWLQMEAWLEDDILIELTHLDVSDMGDNDGSNNSVK